MLDWLVAVAESVGHLTTNHDIKGCNQATCWHRRKLANHKNYDFIFSSVILNVHNYDFKLLFSYKCFFDTSRHHLKLSYKWIYDFRLPHPLQPEYTNHSLLTLAIISVSAQQTLMAIWCTLMCRSHRTLVLDFQKQSSVFCFVISNTQSFCILLTTTPHFIMWLQNR